MKILLGTDILLYYIKNMEMVEGISIMFTWMDRIKAKPYVDVSSIAILTHFIALDSFKELNRFNVLKSLSPKANSISALEKQILSSDSRNELSLRPLLAQLNYLACNEVDLLITENKEMHSLALNVGIDDRVYSIEEFIERMCAEHRDLDDMRGVAIRRVRFGSLDIDDRFFNSFKADYEPYYHCWFMSKMNDSVYIAQDGNGCLRGLLKLKCEDMNDDPGDITPRMKPVKRLKIASLKAHFTGQKLGQRFMRIVFDTAIRNHVEEIYVTLFKNSSQMCRLVGMIEQWGFTFYGYKDGDEQVYVRDFRKNIAFPPSASFPYHTSSNGVFIIPIYRSYASRLIPPFGIKEDSADMEPWKYAIKKSLVLREDDKCMKEGSILLFYQKTSDGTEQCLSAVGIVENVNRNCMTEQMFVNRCRKRSALSDSSLHECWHKADGMVIVVDFLYAYHASASNEFPSLQEIGVATEHFHSQRPIRISEEQYRLLINGTDYEKTFVVD